MAIIMDDLGPPRALTERAIRLPVHVTMSFLPYADDLDSLTNLARQRGHEIFLHLPMAPVGAEDPGPNAILIGLDPSEFRRRLEWAFERVPLAMGVNNHMGSRATSSPEIMLPVLQAVRSHGLSFVDSRTSSWSVADGIAAQLGIRHATRDVFLDNDPAIDAVLNRLSEAERLARRRGQALAIGHPRPTTLAALESWLPAARARGLKIVPAGDLIEGGPCPNIQILQVKACNGPDCSPPSC
ncbi:MAG: divergent polysaccharide deacetylase family protein [Geminicoccaceae bacterium]